MLIFFFICFSNLTHESLDLKHISQEYFHMEISILEILIEDLFCGYFLNDHCLNLLKAKKLLGFTAGKVLNYS